MTRAIVTKSFTAVPDGEVHGRLYEPGATVTGFPAEVALRNGWGVPHTDVPVPPAPGSAPDPGQAPQSIPPGVPPAETPAPAPPRAKAKLTRSVEIEEDGKPVRLAKGAIVEGELAERLIAEGKAVALHADKALGGAPATK